MKRSRVALLVLTSSIMLGGCVEETVTYNPDYADVYAASYSSYPSYDWGYAGDYAPVYATGGWGAYYGRWGGYRGGWAGYHNAGFHGGGFHGGGRR